MLFRSESRALRHVFAAERAASKISDVSADTPVRAIVKVGVIGAGTMGGGIAMNFLNAGIPVVMLETKAEALERGIGTIRKNYENSLKKGKLTQDKLDARMALLQPTLDYADLSDVDLVIEAVFEDMGVKESVFRQLDAVMKPGAILIDNTTASAEASSSSTISRSSVARGSAATLCLPPARKPNSAPSSPSGMCAPDADQ